MAAAVKGERVWWFEQYAKEANALGLQGKGDALPEEAFRTGLTPRAAARATQAGRLPTWQERDQEQAAFEKANRDARAQAEADQAEADQAAQADDDAAQ